MAIKNKKLKNSIYDYENLGHKITVNPYNEIEIKIGFNNCRFKEIGYIRIALDDLHKNIGFTHSYLQKKYRRQGLGLYMYSLAADIAESYGIKLYSSGQSSEDALRVWNSKSLRKKYNVRKVSKNNKIIYRHYYDTDIFYSIRKKKNASKKITF